jgi:hypothetical protein
MNIVTRKARKIHKCVLCGCIIRPFEIYKYATVRPWDHIDNDGYSEYKAHAICDEHWPDYGDFCDWIFPGFDDCWSFVESLAGWLRRTGRELPNYLHNGL